ncbi:MAG: CRTAC1 family protein [Armatimonadota bacterium]
MSRSTTLVAFACLGLSMVSGCTRSTAPPSHAAGTNPAAPPTGTVRFQDVTDAAGLRFVHHNSKTPKKYLIEIMGAGGAFADVDGDGWLDIVLVDGRTLPGGDPVADPQGVRLYRNDGDGTFTDITKGSGLEAARMYGMGVAVADYDGDGRPDIYVSGVLDGGRLFQNRDGRRFRDVTAKAGVANKGRWGTSCAWFDYDHDGRLDLFVANYVKYRTLADDQPCFAGERQKRIYCIPSAYEGTPCTLFRNRGDGTFEDASRKAGLSEHAGKSLGVSLWDVDKDGWLDVFVANDTTPGFLFHNRKDGTFEEIGVESGVAYSDAGIPHSGMGIDTGDVRNDGTMSLLLTNYYGQETNLYHQVEGLLFEDRRTDAGVGAHTNPMVGFGVLFVDVDNDGLLDIFQMSGHVQDEIQEREPQATFRQPALLLRNLGSARFDEVGLKSGEPFSVPRVGRGAAAGDVDHDGRIDLLVTENNGSARLWRNVSEGAGHWTTLKMVATKGAKEAIGAVVACSAGGVRRRATVRTGSSYLSQSDLRVHFGLGTATQADIEVTWPSGSVETFAGVPADRISTLVEGTGKAR